MSHPLFPPKYSCVSRSWEDCRVSKRDQASPDQKTTHSSRPLHKGGVLHMEHIIQTLTASITARASILLPPLSLKSKSAFEKERLLVTQCSWVTEWWAPPAPKGLPAVAGLSPRGGAAGKACPSVCGTPWRPPGPQRCNGPQETRTWSLQSLTVLTLATTSYFLPLVAWFLLSFASQTHDISEMALWTMKHNINTIILLPILQDGAT